MIARFGIAIAIGASITFGLLFVMQLMIAHGRGAITDEDRFRIVDFVRVERENVVETKKEKPDKPPEPEKRPDMPSPDSGDSFNSSIAVSMAAPTMSTGSSKCIRTNRVYLPIVKVAPVYPARAASRGLEGYVIVEYTVTRTGSTRDPIVIESSSSLFERAALDSALKYKYKPRVINGEAVEVPGVRTIIRFELEK